MLKKVPTLTLEEMKEMVQIPEKKYSIGKYQVTHALWKSVMGDSNSSYEYRPAENVSWFDCVEFCNKLSEKEGLEKAYTINGKDVRCNFEANGYRLPTEWEWWFAAKANDDFEYAGSDNIDEVARYGVKHWYSSDYPTRRVGQRKANGFGLFDMSGNVWEWCWDWYEGGEEDSPTEGSRGPSTGVCRVIRGGSYNYIARYARICHRYKLHPSIRFMSQGVRLCRTSD